MMQAAIMSNDNHCFLQDALIKGNKTSSRVQEMNNVLVSRNVSFPTQVFVVNFPKIPHGKPACWISRPRTEGGGENVMVLTL
jgi:hypothetical protein